MPFPTKIKDNIKGQNLCWFLVVVLNNHYWCKLLPLWNNLLNHPCRCVANLSDIWIQQTLEEKLRHNTVNNEFCVFSSFLLFYLNSLPSSSPGKNIKFEPVEPVNEPDAEKLNQTKRKTKWQITNHIQQKSQKRNELGSVVISFVIVVFECVLIVCVLY